MPPVGAVMAAAAAARGAGSGGGPYVKLQTIIDPGDILQHLTFTLAGRDMKSLIECVLLCSSLVTRLINSPPHTRPSSLHALIRGESFQEKPASLTA